MLAIPVDSKFLSAVLPECRSCPCFFSGVVSLAPSPLGGLGKIISHLDGHSIITKRIRLVLYHYTKHICFCQVVCEKILNFFVWNLLDSTKHLCYTGCTMKLHSIQGSVKQVRVEIFAENTIRCLTGSYTDCTVYKQGA